MLCSGTAVWAHYVRAYLLQRLAINSLGALREAAVGGGGLEAHALQNLAVVMSHAVALHPEGGGSIMRMRMSS